MMDWRVAGKRSLPDRSLAGNRVAWEAVDDAWVVHWQRRGAGLLQGAMQQTYVSECGR